MPSPAISSKAERSSISNVRCSQRTAFDCKSRFSVLFVCTSDMPKVSARCCWVSGIRVTLFSTMPHSPGRLKNCNRQEGGARGRGAPPDADQIIVQHLLLARGEPGDVKGK